MTIVSEVPSPVWAGTAITEVMVFAVPNVAVDAYGNVSAGLPTLTDPTTVTVKVSSNEGTFTYTYALAQITKLAVGVYMIDISTTGVVGTLTVEWIGTGACAVPNIHTYYVNALPL